MQYLKGKVAS